MSEHRHSPPGQHEHEFEAAPGLPEPLPTDERMLWQGSPDWRHLARHTFHVRKLAAYFAVILVVRGASAWSQGETLRDAIAPTLVLAGLASLALGLLLMMAWLTARTTVYSITNRRVVMRIGIVLSMTLNLPFSRIVAADVRSDGNARAPAASGDIAVRLAADSKIAYLHLWPHARPWRLARPEPMLRGVTQPAKVAALLAQAWTLSTGQAANAQASATATTATPSGSSPAGLRHAGPLSA